MKVWLGRSRVLVSVKKKKHKKYFEIGYSDFILLKRHKRRRIRISDLNGSKTYLTFPSRYRYCYMNNQYVEGKVIYYHQVWEKWKKC